MGVQQTRLSRPDSLQRESDAAASAPPAVTIVLDEEDHYANTRAALAAHDPAAGRITVHPTPATKGLLTLAQDLMAALGKRPDRMGPQPAVAEAWRQATAWMCGYQISELTLLRAHLLSRSALARLVQLAAESGTQLRLVWHTRPPADWAAVLPTATLYVLDQIQDAFSREREGRPRLQPPVPQPMYCLPRTPQPSSEALSEALAHPLPALPVGELARFRADLKRQLSPAEFACADVVYTAGMDAACAYLTGHSDYARQAEPSEVPSRRPAAPPPVDAAAIPAPALPRVRTYPFAWPDMTGLRAHLLSLVAASRSPSHTLALLRGAQAGFLLHGMLLSLPADPGREDGPGFTAPLLTPQIADRIRQDVDHPVRAAALVVALVTGHAPYELTFIRMNDLSADASRLVVREYLLGERDGQMIFTIPLFARDLLLAARSYVSLGGGDGFANLLEDGVGNRDWILEGTARACGLHLSRRKPWFVAGRSWHSRSQCDWVADPLHENLHASPGRERGAYIPPA